MKYTNNGGNSVDPMSERMDLDSFRFSNRRTQADKAQDDIFVEGEERLIGRKFMRKSKKKQKPED